MIPGYCSKLALWLSSDSVGSDNLLEPTQRGITRCGTNQQIQN